MSANKVRAPAHPAQVEAARILIADLQRGRDHRAALLRSLVGVLLFTDCEFAELCGVGKSTVAGWWKGRRKVPQRAVDVAVALVDVVGDGPPVATKEVAMCSVCWKKHTVSTASTIMPHMRRVKGGGPDVACAGAGSLAVLFG